LTEKNQLALNKLKNDIIATEQESREIELKIKAKEQEISDLDKKVFDMKKTTKKNGNVLDPISNEKITHSYESGSPRQANTFASVMKANDKPDLTRGSPGNKLFSKPKEVKEVKEVPVIRDVTGGKTEDGLLAFSDKDIFENLFSTKIVKITVWVGKSFINGIQASYRVNNSEDMMGNQHLAGEMKAKTKNVESLQIDLDDNISSVSGKYNEGLISLKFQTAKGKIKEFGTTKGSGQEFEIKIEPEEQPTLLFGAFYNKKAKKGKEEIIVANIGFTLMKKVKQPK